MIPKIIHYCWFGRGQMSSKALMCIESWKKILPEYDLKLWNEDNFDITSNLYVKEAYESRKFAFVTDYVRLYAIYNEGGIYMDTDVEVIRLIDSFLSNKAFSGFESEVGVPTGIMAGEKGLKIYKEMLDYYDNKHFVNNDGSYDLTTNVEIITNLFISKGLIMNNEKQTIDDFTLYPKETFCPLKRGIGEKYSINTYTIHHFEGSWLSEEEIKLRHSLRYRIKSKIYYTARNVLKHLIGTEKFEKLRKKKKSAIKNEK